MSTTAERKALVFLGVVACLGGGVRIVRAHANPPPPPAARRALDARIGGGGPKRPAHGSRRRGTRRDTNPPRRVHPKPVRPKPVRGVTPKITVVVHRRPPSPAHRLDVDRATAAELQALPGIGPALAARIVAFRDSAGPFRSLVRLRLVKGIGPAKAKKLDSLVTFSGERRP